MKRLTLTFDNGPEPAVTPAVLDVLARRALRTTFFVIGQKLAHPASRACAERAAAEGHWIGNHTWTHSAPLGTIPDQAEAEIARTQAALGPLAHPKRWFRPVGGGGALGPHLLSPGAAALLQAGQYTCVLWNAVPRDWAEPDAWVDTALAQIARQDWTLLVLHDLPTGAMAHLDRFLDAVQAQDIALHQDFPPDCVPLRQGRAATPLAPFMNQ